MALGCGLLLAAALPAQVRLKAVRRAQPTQDELRKNLEKKLGSPFLENASWVSDYAKARALAKKNNKLIFTYFTRSYAP